MQNSEGGLIFMPLVNIQIPLIYVHSIADINRISFWDHFLNILFNL